jgi:signal transduction histidine kinase
MDKANGSRLAVLAAAVVTAVLIPVYRSQSLPWADAVVAAVMFVMPCVLLGLVVWRATVRARPTTLTWRSIALHAGGAVLFSAVWTGIFASFVYAIRPDWISGFLGDGAVWQFTWGLVIYAAIVQVARTRARLREREAATSDAELQALRSQLNPHFLFNTLHSLGQLAREDPVATQEALEHFGDLMRYVLDAGCRPSAEVPLEEELRFIRRYLSLEGLRLGERLRVVEDIEPDALEFAVPPLLLQPLVENAVRHGLAPRREGGTLRLVARVRGETLVVEVTDDGDGAPPEAWRRAPGMGLKSVLRQLDACFGGAAQLGVTTRPQAGFSAVVRMPARLSMRAPT